MSGGHLPSELPSAGPGMGLKVHGTKGYKHYDGGLHLDREVKGPAECYPSPNARDRALKRSSQCITAEKTADLRHV